MSEEQSRGVKGSERRDSARIDARIHVQFRTGREFIDCYSQNLSRGGIYLETTQLPDPNALIELALLLPEVEEEPPSEIALRGRVVRLMSVVADGKPIHKVAIQFLEVSPDTQMKLDTLFDRLSLDQTEQG